MKVAMSIEVSDSQRNSLAQLLSGKTVKRLATRVEVRDYVEGCIAALDVDIVPEPAPGAPGEARVPQVVAHNQERSFRSGDLIARVRIEDREALAGKSDSFCLGWAKVKYKLGA